MSTPTVVFPDVERLVVDYLAAALEQAGEQVTVGVGVPDGWDRRRSPAHVSVACDGMPWMRHPVIGRASVRVTVRARSTSEAKRLAEVAQGLLLAHPSGGGVAGVRPHSGVMPTRDADTRADLAWFAVGVTVRTQDMAT